MISSLQVPVDSFLVSALIPVVLIILITLLILIFVRRPSPSRETGGAVALALATIILISGLWSMWLSPVISARRYDEVLSRTLLVSPLSNASLPFTLEGGLDVEVYVDQLFIRASGEPSKAPPAPRFKATVYGPGGKLLGSQEGGIIFNLVSEAGSYGVEVSNFEKEALTTNLRVTDRTKYSFRPLEPLGQWLSLISIPIFGLGIWLSRLGRRE